MGISQRILSLPVTALGILLPHNALEKLDKALKLLLLPHRPTGPSDGRAAEKKLGKDQIVSFLELISGLRVRTYSIKPRELQRNGQPLDCAASHRDERNHAWTAFNVLCLCHVHTGSARDVGGVHCFGFIDVFLMREWPWHLADQGKIVFHQINECYRSAIYDRQSWTI